ncbi:MAG: hypothetical protein RL727_508, partial [Pseudomonadota bacterium]
YIQFSEYLSSSIKMSDYLSNLFILGEGYPITNLAI